MMIFTLSKHGLKRVPSMLLMSSWMAFSS